VDTVEVLSAKQAADNFYHI